MGYQKLPPKAANDPLGPGTMNVFRQNQQHLRAMIARDHLVDTGEHNAWEVARVCRRITSAPAVSPSSTDITAVTNPSTGRYVLTLAAGRFTTDMRVRVNPLPEGVKPLIATYKIVSATSVEVYIKKLTSTLGVAGNTWALVNTGFDISIHSQPLQQASWPHGIGSWGRNAAANGYGLSGGGNNTTPFGYSAIVSDSAQFYARLTAEHTSAGAHNVRQVAKTSGRVVYNGSTYKSFDAVDPFTAYTRSSTGVVQLDHASYTTPVSGFVCPDYERYNAGSDGPVIINSIDTSATRTTVTIYKWDSANSWWQVADADFWIDLHQ